MTSPFSVTVGPTTASSSAVKLASWKACPPLMVRELFGVTPDIWQDAALAAFPANPRIVMRACKGPGKTALLAWLGWNFLLCYGERGHHPMIGATSITGGNLDAGLKTELARWHDKTPLLKSMFEFTGKEIYAKDHPKTWKLQFRSWAKDATAEQIGNALAGIHAKYVMWLADEMGSAPVALIPIMEAIFAGNPAVAKILMAGNPNTRMGALYEASVRSRQDWYVVEITGDPDDPKRSPRIPIEHAQRMIARYGRDNPWVKVDILGQFPDQDINTLISIDEIMAATKRSYREHDIEASARVLGVDVAREGDDESVMYPRQGLVLFEPKIWRNIDGIQGAGAVAFKWNDWEADACFVDNTGGYGSSWIDNLKLLGRTAIPVGFATKATDYVRYFNKRAEMYWDAVQWIKNGGQLPPNRPKLYTVLSEITYTHKGDRMLLEDKGQLKDRLGYSPDEADAFIMTFAQHVSSLRARRRGRPTVLPVHDPYAEMFKGGGSHPYVAG